MDPLDPRHEPPVKNLWNICPDFAASFGFIKCWMRGKMFMSKILIKLGKINNQT